MRIKLIVFVFFVFLFIITNAQLQHISYPFIQNYTPKDYNGQPDNFAGIEDNRGFMFFGNLWGILEFDGTDWRNIYFPNGSSGISFAKNNKGVIYCGGRGEFGFLAPDSLGFLQFSSLKHLLDKRIDFGEVWSTFCIDSSIVFCSFEALFVLQNNLITIIEPETAFERAFLASGKLYVREIGRGLCQLTNNKLELCKGGDFFAHIPVSAVLPCKGGKIIVANNKNFYLTDSNSTQPLNNAVVKFLNDSKLFTAIPLSDSNYILATNTKGIVLMDCFGNIQKIFNKSTGLISNDILNVFCDSKGNIWVLSRGGISKIEINGCFNYINEFHGISGLIYTSSFFNSILYLGTSEGLYYKKLTPQGKEFTDGNKFKLAPNMEGNVWALQQFGDDLFCGHNEGVFVINNQKSYHIPGTYGVWCFLQPKGLKNILLAGTYLGIIVLEKNGQTWNMRNYVKGFSESSRFLIQDKMEEFWISHGNKGLFKLTLNHNLDSVLKIKKYSVPEGLGSDYNNTVYSYNNDVIITNNQGFYRYNITTDHIDKWHEFNAAIGKFRTVQRFVVESANSFWVILNDEEILHILKKGEKEFISDITIRKFNKLLSGSFEHILPVNNNIALIASREGVAFFDREKYNKNILLNKDNFKVYIRKLEITRDTIATIYGGEIKDYGKVSSLIPEIKYKQNSVRFTYSSNCFEDIEHTQYQYLLSGFDNSWSQWSPSFQKEYTNLPPGKYKFIIRAQNSYNVVSAEDYFEFVILPPWYSSVFAFIIYLLLFFLLIYGVYKYILFRFRLQKKKLDLKKERELWNLNKKHIEEQIKNENEILKLSNDKLLAEIANLEQQELLRKKDELLKEELDRAKQEQIQHEQEKHQLEINHKNKELSIMAMQIAHKSESISKIREYLINFTENNSSPESKLLTDHLFQHIDNDIQHDKEWKEFQEYFDIVHSSFVNKIKATYPSISPTLLKLCTYIRVKMSNKQIARLINTTVESVLKSRYRLREKLQLGPDESLDDFIENF